MVRFLATLAVGLSLVLSTTIPSYAAGGQAGNVSGTIVDSQSGAAISNAAIALTAPSGSYSTKSNGSGFFTFLGVPVDTYVLSIQAPGYEQISESGVTISGDQTLGLGNIKLSKELRTIGRVTSHSANSAFQPTQTIDSYTISGARITQTTGKEATTNENNLLLAVPGVTLTNAGSPTIRGGSAHEVGYQYDGVVFTEPFLANNGSGESTGSGLFNGIGNVQVVEGAGDATQGNVGSGVINLIPKRGANPAFGYVDAEFGGPNSFHQLAFEYGFANANDSLSDYVAFNYQHFDPYHGYSGQNAAEFGHYFSDSVRNNNQLTNNFVFKFGQNHNQSLQVLYTNVSSVSYGNYGGGIGQLAYYPYDTGPNGATSVFPLIAGYTPAQYAQLIALNNYTPATNVAPGTPQVNDSLQTRFLKFEYDNNLNPTTFLALRYYNWEQLDYNDTSFSNGPSSGYIPNVGGLAGPVWQEVGGPTSGVSLDLTHQFGSKLTVSLNGKYDIVEPVWNSDQANYTIYGIGGGSVQGPSTLDWLPGGYIYDYFTSRGEAVPRLPNWGINYHGDKWQNWGTGLRFQYAPISKVRLDLGVRYEGQNEHWTGQLDQYGQGVPAGSVNNAFAVPNNFFTSSFLQPREWEPRVGATWEIDPSTSIRAGYGRSAVFSVGQNGGTPFNADGLGPYMNIPAPAGFKCGIYNRGPGYGQFPCSSYGAALYWAGDNVEAPDAGFTQPALYSNYDLSASHRFSNGWGVRLTPFYKLGTDLPSYSLITILPGGNEIFGTSNLGFNRTTGLEFNVTTPEERNGVSGFFSATYQNVLSTTPPLSINETAVPLLSPATLALGDIYRAGYVSPFSMRIGGTWNTKSGFSATPVLQYNIGYPYSIGNLLAATIGPNQYANIPQVNFGAGVNPLNGLQNQGGTQLSTNYYDPANPGTALRPNIFVTRGTSATSATGGYLSAANLQANLTLQYKRGQNTVGVQMSNLFGNAFINSVPAVNPFYQPVTTGTSGPLTNQNNCQTVFGNTHGCANMSKETYAFQNGAYLLSNGDFTGATGLAPLQPFTITVYYQHAL